MVRRVAALHSIYDQPRPVKKLTDNSRSFTTVTPPALALRGSRHGPEEGLNEAGIDGLTKRILIVGVQINPAAFETHPRKQERLCHSSSKFR